MTTFTPKRFANAVEQFARVADGKLPKAALDDVGKKAMAVLVAASAASGGLKAPASQFKVKGPNARKGFATAAITGWGFAVLDEFGSYKKPNGFEIEPSYAIGRGQYGKNRQILGNKKTGFAAAYVHHPKIAAHPFQAAATPVIGVLVEKATDLETLKALAKVRL